MKDSEIRIMALKLALQHLAGQASAPDVVDTAKLFEQYLSDPKTGSGSAS